MTDHRNDPLDEVAAEFGRLLVPDRPSDELLLARLLEASGEPRSDSLAPSRTIWRFFMRHAFRCAAAAAILTAAAGWLALTPSRSPALAEVIKAAEEHRLVRFQSTQTGEDARTHERGSGVRTVYVDVVTPRVREEEQAKTFNDILDFRYTAVYDYRRDRFLATVSHEQIVTREQAKDDFHRQLVAMVEERGLAKKEAVLSHIARTKTDDLPPMSLLGKNRGFLDGLRELQANVNTVTTREKLDGREAAKYRLKEGNKTTSVWVDPASKLPIRIEIETIAPTPNYAKIEWVYSDFVWDPEVADLEKLFSTDPPAGYILEDYMNEP
jgi:hypothetical protein